LRRSGCVGALLAFCIVIAVAGWTLVHGFWLYRELTAVTASSSTPSTPADPMRTFEETGSHVRAARNEVAALRPIVDPLASLGAWVSGAPVVGRPVGQASALWRFLEAGATLGGTAVDALDEGHPIGAAASPFDAVLGAVPELAARYPELRDQFERARTARAALGTPAWPFESLAPRLAAWDRAMPVADQLLPLADQIVPTLPTLGGWTKPMTYLVLVQSRDELRATGGFITSVGTVRVEQGRPAAIDIRKVYEAEGVSPSAPEQTPQGTYVVPPAPLRQYMGLGSWHLRDANWAADFPTSARQAARFWELLTGQQVDGVIAFDERFLELLLRATGPVAVPGHDPIDAGSVKGVVLAEVFQGDDPAAWYAAQSKLSQQLASAMLEQVQHVSPDRMPGVADAMIEAFRTRALLVSAFDRTAAAALHGASLDGGLLGDNDDYLYVVESNVSYTKLNPFIKQSLSYAVQLGPDARPVAAELAIEEQNTFRPELADPGYPASYYVGSRWNAGTYGLDSWPGYYGGYTRVLMPAGSRLLRAEGFDDAPRSGTESGRAVVEGYAGLQMGTTRSLFFDTVPSVRPSVEGRYRLVIQRQPGAPARALNVRIRLPSGLTSLSTSPTPDAVEGDVLIWHQDGDTDLEITVTLPTGAAVTTPIGGSAAPPIAPRTPTAVPQPTPISPRGGFEAAYEVDVPTTWQAGSAMTYRVTVHNRGPSWWAAQTDRPVRLGVYFGGPSDVPPGVALGGIPSAAPAAGFEERFDLPTSVPPGGSVTLEITVHPPSKPGRYVLRHRLLVEHAFWFGQFARTDVVVR
jgi:hypothetical protein